MQIIRKEISIKKIPNLTADYIEGKIVQVCGVCPLRWAITKVLKEELILEVAIQPK